MHRVRPARTSLRRLVILAVLAVVVPIAASIVAPPAQAYLRSAVLADASGYARSHGFHVGIAVFDTWTGKLNGAGDYTGTFASESVVKVFIATRLLVSGQMHGATSKRAWKMITQSDDAIASAFYGRVGGDGLIGWIKQRYHVPWLGYRPSRAGWWGNTHIRPAGLVRLYARLKADRRVGPWLLAAMHHAHPYGSDGTYQFFGLPSATRYPAVKQGWGDDYDDWSNSADFNTTGFVDRNRYAVAILARGPIGTYGSQIGALLTAVARRLLPNGIYPEAVPTVTGLSIGSGSTVGGTRVTVHGTAFTHVTRVLFGTVPGRDVQVLSRTALRVTSPRHVRLRTDLLVRTTHGTTARGGHDRFVFMNPPRIDGVAPGSGAAGTLVTIHGSGFDKLHAVRFGAVTAPHWRRLSATTLRVIAPPHDPGAVTVHVVTQYGAADSPQSYTYPTQ